MTADISTQRPILQTYEYTDDSEYAVALAELRKIISICVRNILPKPDVPPAGMLDLTNWGGESFGAIATRIKAFPTVLFGYVEPEQFALPSVRRYISQCPDLKVKLYKLLFEAPWKHWSEKDDDENELLYLKTVQVDDYPDEWDDWMQAVQLLQFEAIHRLRRNIYDREHPSANVEVEALDEEWVTIMKNGDFCYWEAPTTEKRESLESSMEPLVKTTQKVNFLTVKKQEVDQDWRGDHFNWSPGGGFCCR
jgi:hypothetical protein